MISPQQAAIDAFKDEYGKAHGRRPIVLWKRKLGKYYVKRPLVATFDPGITPYYFKYITEELQKFNRKTPG